MRSFFLITVIMLTAFIGFGQHFRLNLYGNYAFNDKVESYYTSSNYFRGTIEGGLLWGASLELEVHDYYSVELLYLHQSTHAPVQYYDIYSFNEKNTTLKMNINWMMAGGMRLLTPQKEKIEPYAGFLLGAVYINAENPETNTSANSTKFAYGMRLGCNFWLTERIALKAQTGFLGAVKAAGGSLYFGTGGTGATISAYSPMVQFSVGGGLTFNFGPVAARKK
jgi:hypothetical protein